MSLANQGPQRVEAFLSRMARFGQFRSVELPLETGRSCYRAHEFDSFVIFPVADNHLP